MITVTKEKDVKSKTAVNHWDLVGGILAYEDGQLDDEGTIELFQHLVDTGIVWTLQGSYARTAKALIEAGHVYPN